MKKSKLPENHHRSVSSSVYLLEKLVTDIVDVLDENRSFRMVEMEKDVTTEKREKILQSLSELTEAINRIARKYQLTEQKLSQSQIINSRKSKMWEILNNTTSKSMKGFGTFPPDMTDEFDNDINKLLQLVGKI